jgi:hypothetical protein
MAVIFSNVESIRKWGGSAVDWREGKVYLQAQDTKTNTPRVLYLTGGSLSGLAHMENAL